MHYFILCTQDLVLGDNIMTRKQLLGIWSFLCTKNNDSVFALEHVVSVLQNKICWI